MATSASSSDCECWERESEERESRCMLVGLDKGVFADYRPKLISTDRLSFRNERALAAGWPLVADDGRGGWGSGVASGSGGGVSGGSGEGSASGVGGADGGDRSSGDDSLLGSADDWGRRANDGGGGRLVGGGSERKSRGGSLVGGGGDWDARRDDSLLRSADDWSWRRDDCWLRSADDLRSSYDGRLRSADDPGSGGNELLRSSNNCWLGGTNDLLLLGRTLDDRWTLDSQSRDLRILLCDSVLDSGVLHDEEGDFGLSFGDEVAESRVERVGDVGDRSWTSGSSLLVLDDFDWLLDVLDISGFDVDRGSIAGEVELVGLDLRAGTVELAGSNVGGVELVAVALVEGGIDTG